MYQSLENASFPFEHCWDLLKDKPKWLLHGPKDKQRRSSMATSANLTHIPYTINEVEGDDVSHGKNFDFKRPIGRKAEKAKRKRKERPSEDVGVFMKKKTESLVEASVQGEEIICLEKEKLQLQRLDREEKMNIERKKLHLQELEREKRIMLLDTNKMSEVQQKYWKARQIEILEKSRIK
jgi:hypothetical protein